MKTNQRITDITRMDDRQLRKLFSDEADKRQLLRAVELINAVGNVHAVQTGRVRMVVESDYVIMSKDQYGKLRSESLLGTVDAGGRKARLLSRYDFEDLDAGMGWIETWMDAGDGQDEIWIGRIAWVGDQCVTEDDSTASRARILEHYNSKGGERVWIGARPGDAQRQGEPWKG